MPDTTKLVSLANLTKYDELIKEYIGTEDAKSIKYVAYDSSTRVVSFYKTEDGTGTAAYTVTLPDTSNFLEKFTMTGATPAVAGDYIKIANDGTLTDAGASVPWDEVEVAAASGADPAVMLDDYIGNIPVGATATTVIGYVDEKAGAVEDIIEALDGSATIASVSGDVVTIKAGLTQTDGAVTNSSDSDITLAAVAKTGEAEDVGYDNTTSGLTATDVQAAIDEVAAASAGGVGSKTVYITETAGSSSDAFSKRYGIYQGATGSASSPVVSEKLADIDLPKDMVVSEGAVVDVVFVAADNSLHEGSASGTDVTTEIKGTGTATVNDAGKYIKLTIANAASSHLWIKATDLVDIYTAQQNATQIQLAIDANNVISATVVAGSIGTTELATDAVTTAKITDGNVTKAKLAQGVQDSLDLADTAIQSADMTAANVVYTAGTGGEPDVTVADAIDELQWDEAEETDITGLFS